MWINKLTKKIVFFGVITLLVACGGGGGGSSDLDENDPDPAGSDTGVLLDSPVAGLGYRTTPSGITGVTEAGGIFRYNSGDDVIFFLGSTEFDSVPAAPFITPLELFDTSDLTDSRVVNLIRLLQTLDDPDDGEITLPESVGSVFSAELDFTLSAAAFEAAVLPFIQTIDSSILVLEPEMQSVDHFLGVLNDNAAYECSAFTCELNSGPGDGSALVGVWQLGDNTIFKLLPDGRYFAIQTEEENGFVGFERGIYTADESTITFSTLQNNDGEALACDEPAGMLCIGITITYGYSINGDQLTFIIDGPDGGEFILTNLGVPGEGIENTWDFGGDGESIFTFTPDGRYFAIQTEEENGFVGFERGTYVADSTTVTFTTLQNNDGEALVCNSLSILDCSNIEWGYSITDDQLTITIPGPDGGVFGLIAQFGADF